MKKKQQTVLLYLAVLGGLAVWAMVRCPIFGGDTDLWSGLSSGRYLLQHHAMPRTSDFSFLQPSRHWIDYYWLFQVIVYALYAAFSVWGLIALRAAAYMATIVLVWRLLWSARREAPPSGWMSVVAFLYAFVLMPRYAMVRAQLFTYFFIALFLYILEVRPRRAAVLPWLGVLWSNLHGASYPILLLLCGTYLLREVGVRGQRTRSLAPVLGLTMGSVLVTPHGWRILVLPFLPMTYTAHRIAELQPVAWQSLIPLRFSGMVPSHWTLIALLLGLTGAGLLRALLRRTTQLHQVLLWVVGLTLFFSMGRFVNECALLGLPLIAANPLRLPTRVEKWIPRAAVIVAQALLLMIACRSIDAWQYALGDPAPYPLSRGGLPEGTAAFLRHAGVGGRVLNHPNTGGYLRWSVPPSYQILMSLEVPFVFRDEDFAWAEHVFYESDGLDEALNRYDPGFITVPLPLTDFRRRIATHRDYVPVMVDNAEALYVNRRHYPDLADQYALPCDPFDLALGTQWVIGQGDAAAFAVAIHRSLEIYRGSEVMNYAAGLVELRLGRSQEALQHARAAIAALPNSPRAYWLEGDAFMRMGDVPNAQRAFAEGARQYARKQRYHF